MAAAMHLLTQAVVFLASQFKKVTVFCTEGNHGRNTARHKERATMQKWDSNERVIYFGMKTACLGIKNITFVMPKTPYYTWQAFDKRGFASHGDTVLNVGYPGNSINVASIKKQANEINAAEAHNGRPEFNMFMCGHVHVGSLTHLPGGAVFMSNGCLIPPDAYAQSIGIFESTCGQSLWESVPGHIMGDYRFITVDSKTDKDKSLDSLVQPFTGF